MVMACSDRASDELTTEEQKKEESKIKTLLTGCKIQLSKIAKSQSLEYNNDIITLDNQLKGFLSPIELFIRNRGILLDGGMVLTTMKLYNVNTKVSSTYAVLFDTKGKTLTSSSFIDANLSVISITKHESSSSLFNIDALVREPGQPAKDIKSFVVKLNNDGSLITQAP